MLNAHFYRTRFTDKPQWGAYGAEVGTTVPPGRADPATWGYRAADIAADLPNAEQIRVIFTDSNGDAFSTPFMSKSNMGAVYDKIDDMVQNASYRSGRRGGGIAGVSVQSNGSLGGGAGEKLPAWLMQVDKAGNSKPNPCIWQIVNDDNMCGQRALAAALADSKHRCRLKNEKTMKKRALEVAARIKVEGRMAINDFDKFSTEYQRRVVIMCSRDESVHTAGEDFPAEEAIYIFYDATTEEGHYHLINNMNTYTNSWLNTNKGGQAKTSIWCVHCNKPHPKKNFASHKCVAIRCRCCQTIFDTQEELAAHTSREHTNQRCPQCNRFCFSEGCLEAHIKQFHTCKRASGGLQAGDVKDSTDWKCGNCKQLMPKHRKTRRWHVCHEVKCENCCTYFAKGVEHRCNVMKRIGVDADAGDKNGQWAFDFETCLGEDGCMEVNYSIARKLGTEERVVHKTIEEFCKWFMTLKQTTLIAHNMKGFDGWLIHNHLIKTAGGQKPSAIVTAGQKIMMMKFKTVTFIDSLNHVAGALDSFPKTFGLDSSKFKKGFFPHKFNLKENQDYVGEIPDEKYFEPHLMGVSKDHDYTSNALCKKGCKYCEFKAWYPQQKGKVYNFQTELHEYCSSDVDILAEGMQVYRDAALQIHGLDPLKSVTAASYATKCWTTNTAPSLEEIDAIEGNDPMPTGALEGNFEYYDAEAPQDDIEKYGKGLHRRPRRTPLCVLSMEEYRKIKKGFRGGRTEVFKTHMKLTPEQMAAGWRILYLDIISLYPTVQFYDPLPYGAPTTVQYGDDDQHKFDLSQVFGMVHCDVTCPQDLLMPVLGGVKEMTPGEFRFVFDLRPFKAAWLTSVELEKAVSLGYRITHVYETISFRKSTHIYKEYMRKCVAGKIEANGYAGTDAEREAFVAECNKALGVTLGPLKKNAGMKAIHKLSCNSLWGRTGMKPDMKQNQYCKTYNEFQKYVKLAREKKIVIHERASVDDGFLITYTTLEEKKTTLTKTNVALCAFVTANARLRLYEMLSKLGDRVIYGDTDSLIFLHKPGDEEVPTGKQLGDWEDEFDSPDEFIEEIACLAPKTYCFRSNKGATCTKSKGFSLNYATYEKINFDSYVAMVKQQIKQLEGEQLIFKKSKAGLKVKTGVKQLSMKRETFKRKIVGFETRPYREMDDALAEMARVLPSGELKGYKGNAPR